ncbi:MAG: UbiA family prenyltransferase [Candidatus Delongbacteria bacterium]
MVSSAPSTRLAALLEACRPLNVVLGALSSGLGALLAGGPAVLVEPWLALAGLATALSLAAGNLWNDLADQAEDALNRPGRPLVSGRLSPALARRAAALLSLGGLGAGLGLGTGPFLFVLACQAALRWYALRGKQAGLAGNLVVAGLAGAAVAFGGLAAGGAALHSGRLLAPALLAGLLHLLRELVKDLEDRPGDLAAGRRTWVLRVPAPALRRLLAQLSVLTLLPPLLALLLARDPLALRLAHLAALFVAPLLLRWMLRAGLDSGPELHRLAARLKGVLGAGLALYALAGLCL